MSLDHLLTEIVQQSGGKAAYDETQSEIHPEIYFRFNSVNLVIGKRGSGKTFTTMRELLKLALLQGNPFTQIIYCTDKKRDDTVERFMPFFEEAGIFFHWVPTDSALELIEGITQVKANLAADPNDKVSKKCLNYHGKGLPHTIIIFDDCIGLFKKDSKLSKKLFENRQSRITYFLLLQDTQGLSPSMKANIDSLTLFGGFPKNKYQILMYQLPPVDFTFDDYHRIKTSDMVRFDFLSNDVKILFRENGDENEGFIRQNNGTGRGGWWGREYHDYYYY